MVRYVNCVWNIKKKKKSQFQSSIFSQKNPSLLFFLNSIIILKKIKFFLHCHHLHRPSSLPSVSPLLALTITLYYRKHIIEKEKRREEEKDDKKGERRMSDAEREKGGKGDNSEGEEGKGRGDG